MSCKLPADCLYEIFKYLNKDSLRSFLLVNRLCCELSVPILWTNIHNYNTLISCLPNESKEVLCKNEIIISTLNSKPPLFNYITFVKNLSMNEICENVTKILIASKIFDNDKHIVVIQEILKMVMNRISLKRLDFNFNYF